MLYQNIIILLTLLVVFIVVIFYYMKKEEFCNCTGMGARTANPTYYVYRPFGDVSNYGNDYSNKAEFIKIGAELPMAPAQNLGWKTGMPYDAFVSSMNENNWAAGSDPQNLTHSSVPMLANGCTGNLHKSNNGGYATNYGSGDPDANKINGAQFITGQYGFPNMLSNGQPKFVGPAGPFIDATPCASANAYNLGIGVL